MDSTALSKMPATQVVMLGASNLTLSWPRIMDLLEARSSSPLQIYTAHGMGRSYVCNRSTVAFRQLPGILVSGLWEALPEKSPDEGRSLGILTDFGNDLLYGREPHEIVQAADECIRRLRAWDDGCHLVLTRPPIESVESLGRMQFRVARLLLFPLSRLPFDSVKSKARELDAGLTALATKWNIPVFQPQAEWYGIDPIHVRRRYQRIAFRSMMELWPGGTPVAVRASNRSRPPVALRWDFGKERRTKQPALSSAKSFVFAY